MQINQQLVRFNWVLTQEINKKIWKVLSVPKLLFSISTNCSLVSVNQVLTE